MELLRDLNQSQGTTYVVVTHDPAVARQTNRIVVLEDGKIAREDIVSSPLEEDLKMWRHSDLGQRILNGDEEALQTLGIPHSKLEALELVLKNKTQEVELE